MDFVGIVLSAAKAAKVSGALLLAICSHESEGKNVIVEHDGGTPSYGICQVKYGTAQMMGYKGGPEGLMNPRLNAKFAAKYVAYQVERYGEEEWCKIVAAYNAGTFTESKKLPGKPRNLKYVKRVQNKLDEGLQERLSCEFERK